MQVGRNQRGKFIRAVADRFIAQADQALAHFRQRHHTHHLGIQALHDLARRAAWCCHRVPRLVIKIGDAGFDHRWHFGQHGGALLPRGGERAQLAGADVRQWPDQGVEGQVHFAAKDGYGGGRIAFVRHMQEVDTRLLLESLSAQMQRPAAAGRAVTQLAGVGLGVGHHLAQRGAGGRRMRRDHQRISGDQADRRQVFGGIPRQFLQMRLDRHAICGEQNRVAIGRRVDHKLGADIAARSRTRLNHYRLAQALAHLLADQARG